MILDNGVMLSSTEVPMRPLLRTRRAKPKMIETFHASCPRCGWKDTDRNPGFLRMRAKGHVCE